MNDVVVIIYAAGFLLAAITQTIFVILWGIKMPWTVGYVGWAVWTKSAMFAVVLWLTILNVLTDFPGKAFVNIVVIWLVAGACTAQVVGLAARMWPDKMPGWVRRLVYDWSTEPPPRQ